MPPLPRFQIDAIADLATQLRFAPRSALVRDLERTEDLAYELDAQGQFPLDYIVFRVTGYRSKQGEGMETIAGDVLLGELATLAEHLSAAAKIDLSSLDDALSADELCERWSVSRKTLERYRRKGLLSRRVVGPGGKPRVAYTQAAITAFEKREPRTIEAAGEFTRLEPELRERVLKEAVEQARTGKSLNQAALAIAERIGRGHETVRQILRQSEQDQPEPMFEGTGPLSPLDRRMCYRAWRRAIEPGAIAERVGKPRSSVLRVTTDERAAVLRKLLPEIARGLRDEAPDEVAIERLGRAPNIGLDGPDLLEDLLALARGIRPISAAEERVWLAACRELRRRAAGAIDGLPEHGNASPVVDQIETDLRWSSRIKAELVRAQLPTILRAIESRLASSAEDLGTSMLQRAFRSAIQAGADAIDAVHPSDRGRLAAPVLLAVDRRVRETVAAPARAVAPGKPGKARRKIAGQASFDDFTVSVYRWQHAVEPDPRLRGSLDALDDRDATILRRRFGYAPCDTGRPITLAELADSMDSKPLHVARSERAAVRRALEAARRSDTIEM